MISHHAALVYAMVMVSAADSEISDAELAKIGEIISGLPVFADYPTGQLVQTAAACAELLDQDDGLERALELIAAALPARIRETAYALACDVAAADGSVRPEEIRMLEMLRHRLEVGRLPAAAIERAARARFATL